MTSLKEEKSAHPALSQNDESYTAILAAKVFADPDRFMQAWRIAMSCDDNDDAALLLHNLRIRPDYFGPLRQNPRRFGFSAMLFQRDFARDAASLRETVISTRRQVDRFNLKELSRRRRNAPNPAGSIQQAIASAIADLLDGIALDLGAASSSEKVLTAVDSAAAVADQSASRMDAPDAATLSRMSADLRMTARASANDDTFRQISSRLEGLELNKAKRASGKEEQSEDCEQASTPDDGPPPPWKKAGSERRRTFDPKTGSNDHQSEQQGVQ